MSGPIIAALVAYGVCMTIAAFHFATAYFGAARRARRANRRADMLDNLLERRRDREAGIKKRAPNGQFAS